MISEQDIKTRLETAAVAKLSFAAQSDLNKIEDLVLSLLLRTKSTGGIIRIISDLSSRWSAHHLNEELVVRFKSGSEYNRSDRAAINSRQYSEYDKSLIIDLISSGRFDFKKDTLIAFCSDKKSEDLEKIILAANKIGLPTVIIAPENQNYLLSLGQHAISIKSSDSNLIEVMHTIVLHSLCERFEPEYDNNIHGLVPSFQSSAKLDRDIASKSDIVQLISRTSEVVLDKLVKGATLFLAGNGGSSCQANALTEFLKNNLSSKRPRFEIFDLHSPDVILCAYNDNHPPFARQIDANGCVGDLLLVYSTSGNSQNIIDAVIAARKKGIYTIALLGRAGGKLFSICDCPIVVPSNETSRIQEAHALLGQLVFT